MSSLRLAACPHTKAHWALRPHFGVGAWLAIAGPLVLGGAPSSQALSVSPTVVELRAATGTQTRGVFHVVNDTEAPMTLSVELEPLSQTGYASRRPRDWLQVSPTTLQLLPQEQAEVAYLVSIPPETQGELAAEVVFVQNMAGAATSGIQVRFGMALYAAIAGTERLQVAIGPMLLRGGTSPTVVIPLTNDGNVHCRPEGSVAVLGAGNTPLARGTLTRGLPSPPGREEHFTVSLADASLPAGRYRLSADLTCHATAAPPARLTAEQPGQLDDHGQWIPTQPPSAPSR